MTLEARRRALLGASSASSNQLLGDWGRIYVERITIGENSVANTISAVNLIAGKRSDTSGNVFMIRRVSGSPAPANNEFGGFIPNPTVTTAPKAYRYRSGWSTAGISAGYDAVISSGSVFDVLSLKFNAIVS